MRNKIFGFFALLGFVIAVGKAWHFAKDGFCTARIAPFYEKEYRSLSPSSEAKEALDQPYRYLDRGRQCYAFESADGAYVLKLPRFDHFRIPFWLRAVPFFQKYRETLIADKQKRHRFLLGSFCLAEEELQEETGLLYLHLGETDFFQKKVQIIDRLGRKFWLDLDQAAFALQKKEPLFMPILFESLQKGEKEKAKEIFHSFLQLIETCKQKGISNKDPHFLKNFGYDGERAVYIDIGSFYRKEEALK